jgi:divalent metal cation (Fe/Co/Zn/Cd) transporter
LIGEAAAAHQRAAIVGAIEGNSHVEHLIHIRTEHLGPDEILVAAKVEFNNDLSFEEVAAAINATEERIRAAVPTARLIYIEPDVHRAPTGG